MCPQPTASLIIHTSSTRFRHDGYKTHSPGDTGKGGRSIPVKSNLPLCSFGRARHGLAISFRSWKLVLKVIRKFNYCLNRFNSTVKPSQKQTPATTNNTLRPNQAGTGVPGPTGPRARNCFRVMAFHKSTMPKDNNKTARIRFTNQPHYGFGGWPSLSSFFN